MDQQCFHEFGVFRLDPSRRLLYRNRDLVHLAPKAIEILALLVERPKEVLSKQELMEASGRTRMWKKAISRITSPCYARHWKTAGASGWALLLK
jgi:DNA-binding winged helix-turn-helix (wHTH) protein